MYRLYSSLILIMSGWKSTGEFQFPKKKKKKVCFFEILKMLSNFCFSKLGAPLFRFCLSHPETSISGDFCVPTHLRRGHPSPFTMLKIVFFIISRIIPENPVGKLPQGGQYTAIECHPQGRPEPKRHRKWTFQDETNKT